MSDTLGRAIFAGCIAVVFSHVAMAGEPVSLPALDPATAGDVSYRRDIWPLVKRHCWSCHHASDARGGLNLDSVATFSKGGDSGPAFAAGQPDESQVVRMLTGALEPSMPKDKPRLSAAHIHLFRQWILAGAKDDSPALPAAIVAIPAAYRRAPAATSLAFSPDGLTLAVTCQSEVLLVDAASGSLKQRLSTESELVNFVEFSPDGTILAAAGGSPGRFGEIRLFNPIDGAVRSTRRLGNDTLFRGGYSPDGSRLALGAADGAVWVVPMTPDAEPARHELHSDWVSDVCFSPDGRVLISGGRDKTVKVSLADSGKLLRSVASSDQPIGAVAAAPNVALAAGRDRQPAALDLNVALANTEYNPAAANATQTEANPAQYTRTFEGQPGEALDCATNPARTWLAVAGAYPEVRIYNVADLQRVATLAGVSEPVYAVAFSPDGMRLAAGSFSGQVSLFELPSGKLLQQFTPAPLAAGP